MHKQAIKHKQAIIGGGYLFTENACLPCLPFQFCLVIMHVIYKIYYFCNHMTYSTLITLATLLFVIFTSAHVF